MGVELHHPVAHDLNRDPAEPGCRGAGCPLIDRGQGQQAPRLRAVLGRAGDRAQRMGIKVCPERNRHGEPPSFATLNQTCLKPTRPNRVTPSGTGYYSENQAEDMIREDGIMFGVRRLSTAWADRFARRARPLLGGRQLKWREQRMKAGHAPAGSPPAEAAALWARCGHRSFGGGQRRRKAAEAGSAEAVYFGWIGSLGEVPGGGITIVVPGLGAGGVTRISASPVAGGLMTPSDFSSLSLSVSPVEFVDRGGATFSAGISFGAGILGAC